ncbi:MAG: hypothetical protein C0497_11515 [Gemmatimonas sp.]|nr:hypothetical protein [Gemmatimonas sp.]
MCAVAGIAICSTACGGGGGPTVASSPGTPVANAPITPQTMDCVATNPSCPELIPVGDAPYVLPNGNQANARGFADPSMRRDPSTGTLWMAYSWPAMSFQSATQGAVTVSNHLARSVDGGATWLFVRSLWTSSAATDAGGAPGYMNQETVSLAPRATAAGTMWYSARLQYFTTPADGPDASSFVIRVASASSPELLASAADAALGGAATATYWHADANLSSLSPDLARCVYNDPGLLARGDTLYLAVECQVFEPSGERPDKEFVAVFSTLPSGAPRTWSWRYLGKLASASEAAELGGQSLLQTDLVVAQDGTLLAIMSPSAPGAPLAQHFGCRVVEVASLASPRLARDNTGRLRVRASVTMSDMAATGSPGSCGYDPASATGIVIARRVLGPGQLVSSLRRTGLRP